MIYIINKFIYNLIKKLVFVRPNLIKPLSINVINDKSRGLISKT